MRKIYLLFFLLVAQTSFSQLLTFDFAGIAGGEATVNSSTNAAGVQTSVISRGSGVTAGSNADRFNSTNWTTATSPDLTDYVEFTVTPAAGFTLDITNIGVLHQRSGTGPVAFVIRTSLDAYAADATNVVTISDVATTQNSTFTFTSPINTTSAVTIRLYAYSAEATGGSWGPGDGAGSDISVNGTATSAINTITTGAVAATPFCIDPSTQGTGTVNFSATGTYNTTFTAYLSDASGSFSSGVAIGSTTVNGSNPTGSINITIPSTTPSGTGYRIRVDAASPALAGSESTAFEIINGAKNVSNLSVAAGGTTANISWSNPSNCWEEVMIVVKAGASVTGTPTGDGSSYTASTTFGSGTSFDGGFVVYKGTTSTVIVTGLTTGTTYYIKAFTRRGSNWSTGVEVSATPNSQPGPGDIVINQLSPDYDGASNEYIELVNKTNTSYDLSGLAIRYQSATSTGSTSSLGTLSGTILPKRYWLLSPDATITVGMTNNLARDGAVSGGMAAGNGQIALVRISDNVIVDAVGYGSVTGVGTYTETSAAPAPPADGGIRRITDGTDTENNSVDFATVATADIFLRNSASAPLPVRFNNIKAIQRGNSIEVAWSNATEENVVNYSIERSSNGRSFGHIGQLTAKANNGGKADYSFIDATPVNGDNFYRIKAVETSGKIIYSNIVRMNTAKKGTELVLYPNPLKGSDLNVQFSNLPAGKYTIKVIAINGQELDSRLMNHTGGNLSETITLKNLKPGVYALVLNGSTSLNKTFLVE